MKLLLTIITACLLAGCQKPVAQPAPVAAPPVTQEDVAELRREIAAIPKIDFDSIQARFKSIERAVVNLDDVIEKRLLAARQETERKKADTSGEILPIRLLYFAKVGCRDGENGVRIIINPKRTDPSYTYGLTPDKHIQFVDMNERDDLADQYHVTVCPTWILVDGWKEIGRVDPDTEPGRWDVAEFVRLGLELYNAAVPDPPRASRKTSSTRIVETYSAPVYTPLVVDTWDVGRLAYGNPVLAAAVTASRQSRRAQLTGYPIRPDWPSWRGCDNWQHMTTGEHESMRLSPEWLQSLTWAELQSAHADAHQKRFKWGWAVRV